SRGVERVATGAKRWSPGEGTTSDGAADPHPSHCFAMGPFPLPLQPPGRSARGAGEGIKMLTYVAKRFGLAVAVVAVVIAVLFLMIYIIPGAPLSVALGPRANPVQVEALRLRMGLDKPLLIQLLHFYGSVLSGNLGSDILSDEPVLNIIMTLLP